jgi:hypothetical protein
MKRQNVTLSLPEDVLRKARHMAVERNMSLSAFLSVIIQELVAGQGGCEQVRENSLRLMEEGFDMGTMGEALNNREELHDRG